MDFYPSGRRKLGDLWELRLGGLSFIGDVDYNMVQTRRNCSGRLEANRVRPRSNIRGYACNRDCPL